MSENKKKLNNNEKKLSEEQMKQVSGGIKLNKPDSTSSASKKSSIDYFDQNSK